MLILFIFIPCTFTHIKEWTSNNFLLHVHVHVRTECTKILVYFIKEYTKIINTTVKLHEQQYHTYTIIPAFVHT